MFLKLFRRQLRKAVVDHVSDSFLEPDTPLLMLLAAAREGHEKEVSNSMTTLDGIFTIHPLTCSICVIIARGFRYRFLI